jgi:heat shock protein HtpX
MLARFAFMFGAYGGGDSRRRDGQGQNPLVALAMLIVAPIAALIIQMAISRSREYAADEAGARLSGKPLNLAHALLKLERRNEQMPADVNPATAHMYIVNPLHGGIGSLFSTHPPIEERVARLEALAQEMSAAPSGRLTAERRAA